MEWLDQLAGEKAEDQLRLLMSIIEQSTEGFAIVDLEGHIIFLNEAFAAAHGYTVDELVGKNLSIFHTPDQMAAVEEANRQIRQTGQFSGEIWHVRRDGSVFPTLMQNALLRNERGEPIGMIGTLRDITDLKEAEEELRQSEQQYRETLRAMGDAIHVVDRDLRILLFNTAFEQWCRDLGLESRPLGRTVFEAFPFLPPQVRDEYLQVFKTGRTVLTTDVPACIDGHELFTETRKIPVFRGDQVVYCVTVVRDVTAQQRAEEGLRRYAHRIETLREIERAVLAAQSPAAIVQAALLRVHLLVPCRWASVAILAERGEEAEVLTFSRDDESIVRDEGYFPTRELGDIDIFRRGEPLLIDDASAGGHIPPGLASLAGKGQRAFVHVPLLAHGELIGLFSLASDQAGAFSADHVEVAHEIADMLAIAIQNARLLQREHERRSVLEAVRQASLHLTSSLDLQQVLETILEHGQELVAADEGHIFLYDGEQLSFGAALWAGQRQREPYAEPRTHGLTYTVARRGERIVVPRVKDDPLFADYGWESSIVGLPLRIGKQVIGVMTFTFEHPHVFSADELNALDLLADQAAIAVENARLFQAEQQQQRRLALLAEVARLTASVFDANVLLQAVADSIQRHFDYQTIELFTLDEETDELVLCGYRGPLTEAPETVTPGTYRQSLDVGIVGYVAQTGQSYNAPDVSSAPFYYAAVPGIRSELCVPIRQKSHVIGVLNLESNQPARFGPDDQSLLEAVADTVAIGLQNARLYRELRQHTVELEAALEQLKELDRLKSEFIQNVSHELRSPIALIRGYADLLEAGDLGPLRPEQQEPVAIIARRTRMLAELVEDITLILGAEARPLAREAVPLDELARAAVKDFKLPAERAGLTLKADIAPNLPPVAGESIYLRRVLDNLIGNAIKFTPPGGNITVRLWQEDQRLKLQVSDTGIGIAPEQQERVFERFYQVDGSSRRRYGGVGLGLTLVKEVVTSLGGTVKLESEPGQGSTFTVALDVWSA